MNLGFHERQCNEPCLNVTRTEPWVNLIEHWRNLGWTITESWSKPDWTLTEPLQNPHWTLIEPILNPDWDLTEPPLNPDWTWLSEPSLNLIELRRNLDRIIWGPWLNPDWNLKNATRIWTESKENLNQTRSEPSLKPPEATWCHLKWFETKSKPNPLYTHQC